MALIDSGTGQTTGPGPTITMGSSQAPTYATYNGAYYESLRKLVMSKFEKSEAYCRAKFEKFYRFEKLIQMVSKKKAFDWKANAFLPYGFSVAEQSASMKWLGLFLTRPFVTVQARKAGLDEVAMRRQALIDWHLTGEIDMIEFGGTMFRMAERYGKAVALIAPRWDHKIMKARARENLPTALGPIARIAWKTSETKTYAYDAAVLDLTDFFPEPGKRRINGPNGMRSCHRRYHLTKDELLDLEAAQMLGASVGGQSVEEVKDTHYQDMDEYKQRRLFLDKYDDVDRYSDEYDKSVELIETYIVVPRELIAGDPELQARAQMEEQAGRDPLKRIVITANKGVILEDIALPWDHRMWPFIEMDCVPDPHEFYGKGKVEVNEHLIYAGNEIMNMRLDNVKQVINALTGVDGTKMPAGWKRRMVSQPMGIIETLAAPRDVIHRLPIGDVTQSSYTEQQQLYELIQDSSAINETMVGKAGVSGKTLGEHQLKAELGSKRLQFELVGQAQQLLGYPYGLAGFLMSLDRQYLPLPTYMQVLDPQTPDDMMEISLGPEDFAVEDELFAYSPTGAIEGLNLQAKREDLTMMLQALSPFGPVLLQMGFDFAEMVKTIIKTFGHDPARFFQKVQGPASAGEGGVPPTGMGGVAANVAGGGEAASNPILTGVPGG